jgi:hypothetical protein
VREMRGMAGRRGGTHGHGAAEQREREQHKPGCEPRLDFQFISTLIDILKSGLLQFAFPFPLGEDGARRVLLVCRPQRGVRAGILAHLPVRCMPATADGSIRWRGCSEMANGAADV